MFGSVVLFLSYQEPRVNLMITGERLENAAPVIARAVGYNDFVRINPEYKNQVVVIKVKDVPRSEFLVKLKQSMRLEFFKTKEGFILDLSPQMKAEEEKIAREARQKSIDALFDRIKIAAEAQRNAPPTDSRKLERDLETVFKTFAEKKDFPERNHISPLAETISKSLPTTKAALAVAAKIPRSVFRDIKESNPRIVFSSEPTPMQKPLEIDWKSAATPGLEEIQSWLDTKNRAFAKYGSEPPKPFETRSSFSVGLYSVLFKFENDKFTSARWNGMIEDPNAKYDRCQAVVSYNGYPRIKLRFLNKDGAELFSRSFPQDLPDVEFKRPSGKGGIGQEKQENQSDPRLFEFPNLVQNLYQKKIKEVSTELTQKLLNVEKFDFLGYCIGPLIAASAGDRNIIAPIDDKILYYSRFQPEAEFPFNRYNDVVEKNDRWIVRTYANPKDERGNEMNRSVLGDLFRYTDRGTKKLTITEDANLMARARFEWGNLDHFETERNWNRNLFRPADFSSDYNGSQAYTALFLYGLLTDQEKQTGSTTEGIDISLLNGRAQNALNKLFFHNDHYPTWLIYNQYAAPNMLAEKTMLKIVKTDGTNVYTSDGKVYSFASYERLNQEATQIRDKQSNIREMTDLFPRGLQKGIKLMVGHEFFYKIRDDLSLNTSEYAPIQSFEESTIARALAFKNEPGQLGETEKRVNLNKMIVDTTERLSIGLKLPDTNQTLGWYHQPRQVIASKTYRFENLPKEMKGRIETLAKQYKSD